MKRKNLIVTCGTSQILKFRNKTPENVVHQVWGEIQDFVLPLVRINEGEAAPTLAYLDNPEVKRVSDMIWKCCEPSWENRIHNLGVENNILGAEIGTLVAMENGGEDYAWDPEVDYFQLIASHSRSGLFAASAVAAILRNGYRISSERIKIFMVPGLTTNTVDPDQAMYNLATVVKNALKQDSKSQPWANIFVGSGGFKSTLPLLTLYSFLFGIPLVNTYELSSHLQRLSPRVDLENRESREFWRSTWKELKKKRWMAEDTSRYVQFIMDFRTDEAKDASF